MSDWMMERLKVEHEKRLNDIRRHEWLMKFLVVIAVVSICLAPFAARLWK